MTWALGFDLGGTALKYALVSHSGESLVPGVLPSRAQEGSLAVFEQILTAGRSMLETAQDRGIRPVVVGLGTPGTIDQASGTVGGALPNMPGWAGTEVVDGLRTRLGLPSFADNDANVMTLAEARFGAGRGFDPVFGITLGTGIGGGLVIDGRIYRGRGHAGEIGHTSVVTPGRSCKCGQRGCLELYAAASALSERYQEEAGCSIAASVVLDRWKEGDTIAAHAVDAMARWLAVGVGNALNLLHPACLILGGGVMEAGNRLLDRLGDAIRKHCLPDVAETVVIRRALMGNQAGVVGAGLFALDCLGTRSP